jgi:hypothetical protein
MERWNTSVLEAELRDAEGLAFDFLVYLPGKSSPSLCPRRRWPCRVALNLTMSASYNGAFLVSFCKKESALNQRI